MKSFRRDLEIVEGIPFSQSFTWKSGLTKDTATPVDLSGCTAAMQVRDKNDVALLLDLSTGSGLTIFDQNLYLGRYGIDIAGTESQGLCLKHRDVPAVYDLVVSRDGTPLLRQHGNLLIRAAVNRPWEA